jgi:cell wall-associated NlpC family hydrolase
MFGVDVEAAARAHALREYPKEACGLVIFGRYEPQRNVAAAPENAFEIAPDCFSSRIEAIVHSHCSPRHGREPSAADMAFQIEHAKPFGIVHTDGISTTPILWWGDFRLDEPLEGREFIHGVLDCYALIRAWFWQARAIKLCDVPRDPSWWAPGAPDLYAQWSVKAGFAPIAAAQVRPGDVAVFKSSVRGVPPHHAGVLIDAKRLLHHRAADYSSIDPIQPLLPFIHSWYRHGHSAG